MEDINIGTLIINSKLAEQQSPSPLRSVAYPLPAGIIIPDNILQEWVVQIHLSKLSDLSKKIKKTHSYLLVYSSIMTMLGNTSAFADNDPDSV